MRRPDPSPSAPASPGRLSPVASRTIHGLTSRAPCGVSGRERKGRDEVALLENRAVDRQGEAPQGEGFALAVISALLFGSRSMCSERNGSRGRWSCCSGCRL